MEERDDIQLDGIDWEAGELHFTTETSPRLTLRDYARMTPHLSWTGRVEVDYQVLKDYAKRKHWVQKRAEHYRSLSGGLSDDIEIVYGLAMDRLVTQYDKINARDLAQLVAQIVKLQELLFEQIGTEQSNEQDDYVTRDEVLDIAWRIPSPTKESLLKRAAEAMAEKPDVVIGA